MVGNKPIERLKQAVEATEDDLLFFDKNGKVCLDQYAHTEEDYQHLQLYAINALHKVGFVGYATIKVFFKIDGVEMTNSDRHFITLPNFFNQNDTSTSGGEQRRTEHTDR